MKEKLSEFERITYSGLNDAEIWRYFQEGDEKAFVYVYRKYFADLYRYGSKFCFDNKLVEDAIQDLFIDLREKKNRININSSLKFYLFQSLRRRLLLYLKKIASENEKLDSSDSFLVTISVEKQLIESQLEEENRKKLENLLNKLTVKQREIIYLFYYENLSYSQIQTIMGLAHVRSVRNLLYRALNVLKSIATIVS